jgi:hypothetical protein
VNPPGGSIKEVPRGPINLPTVLEEENGVPSSIKSRRVEWRATKPTFASMGWFILVNYSSGLPGYGTVRIGHRELVSPISPLPQFEFLKVKNARS